ncbi:MAG: hypothetical protein IH804_07665, partial [Planctomycetes bacterium]|nr:hypothetical protein [Planctomycetota bacterium]
MARESEHVLAAVVVPGIELVLVGQRHLRRQASLNFVYVELDADLLPLLADGLHDLRVLNELATEGRNSDYQATLAIC